MLTRKGFVCPVEGCEFTSRYGIFELHNAVSHSGAEPIEERE